ncbi:MAG: hypothetical protein H7Z40_01255 [Phycisphaerae bacterium]|nr:hypothetical protein [Gemmatimonadaceae bacterium]
MFTLTQPWFNTTDFTVPQLVLFAAGCIGWVVAYIGTAITIYRRKVVEIPAGAVAANVAWEFVWGFIFGSTMGRVFTWGYALWCLQDVYITYSTFKYGHKQIANPHLRRWFKPAMAFGIVAWGVAIYFFVYDHYDNGYGAITGYILNVMMSALYILLLLQGNARDFSPLVGWSKMIGTGLLSVFGYIVNRHNLFLMSLCAITLFLDLVYVALLHARRPSPSDDRMAVEAAQSLAA